MIEYERIEKMAKTALVELRTAKRASEDGDRAQEARMIDEARTSFGFCIELIWQMRTSQVDQKKE